MKYEQQTSHKNIDGKTEDDITKWARVRMALE